MGQFCRRCNPKQRGPYPNIPVVRANEHKWRPIGSNENMPWVVVTIPDELEKNGQPQNEKMKFESSKHESTRAKFVHLSLISGREPTTLSCWRRSRRPHWPAPRGARRLREFGRH